MGELEDVVRAKHRRRIPVVLTRDEVREILRHVEPGEQAESMLRRFGAAFDTPCRLRYSLVSARILGP